MSEKVNVKEFAVNNKMLTAIVTILMTALTGGSVNGLLNDDKAESNIAVLEYRVGELEESKDKFDNLVISIWTQDIFGVKNASNTAGLPDDSGTMKWAFNKLFSKECNVAYRYEWENPSTKDERALKAKKINGGDVNFPIIHIYEGVPYLYYSLEEFEPFVPTPEDTKVKDWKLSGCNPEDRST